MTHTMTPRRPRRDGRGHDGAVARLRGWLRASRLPVAAAALVGCSYTSEYVAPADGRARVVWHEDDVVPLVPPMSPACMEAVAWTSGQHPRPVGGYYVRPGVSVGVWWTPGPGYYGPRGPTYGGGAYVAPPPPVHVGAPPVTHVAAPPPATGAHAPLASSGGGGGGGGRDAGVVYLALLVAVVTLLPVVDLLVATRNPESSDGVRGIDRVNAYNDLARSPGSPCFVPPMGAQP